MTVKKFKLVSDFDSLILGVMMYIPKNRANLKGILQFTHGMTERKERYTKTMEFFASRGYVCIIHDHRGHGESVKSTDDLGYFYNDGDIGIVEDLRRVSEYVREQYPGLPLYIIAHSMGTLVTRVYLRSYDNLPNGVFLCGSPSSNNSTVAVTPILENYSKISGDRFRGQLINDLFVGIFDFNFKNENQRYAWMCSDKSVVTDFLNDPLCAFSFTINGYKCLLSLLNQTYVGNTKTAKNPGLPIMFLSGTEDSCMLGYKKFTEAVGKQHEAGYSYVGYKLYEGMRHEILNEPDRETVYNNILKHIKLFENMKNIL